MTNPDTQARNPLAPANDGLKSPIAGIEDNDRRICLGLLRRRSCWWPTVRGWLVLAVIAVVLGLGLLQGTHRFLVVQDPVHGGLLVVEGWLPDYALEEAVAEFRRHPYQKLCVTGIPLEQGRFLSEYKSYANVGVATLKKLGLTDDMLIAVPAPRVRKDRTYACALALRKYFQEQEQPLPQTIHVISLGPHARRSRLLFEKAMGSGVVVGVSAVEDRDYDPDRWWASSDGVRTAIGEMLAYCYARLFFWASE